MPLTKQGKIELLNSIIQNEYWIGLFSNSESALSGDLLNFGVSSTLEDISGFEFTNKIEYRRKKIEPSDWIVDENNFRVYLSSDIVYSTKLEDWSNIQGYFICDGESEGNLLYIHSYDTYEAVIKNGDTLNINPNIYI